MQNSMEEHGHRMLSAQLTHNQGARAESTESTDLRLTEMERALWKQYGGAYKTERNRLFSVVCVMEQGKMVSKTRKRENLD